MQAGLIAPGFQSPYSNTGTPLIARAVLRSGPAVMAIIVGIFASPVQAQQQTSDPSIIVQDSRSAQLEASSDSSGAREFAAQEIVVTAQKRSESINDVGMSITAVSGEELVNLGVKSADDLAGVVPGFTYTKSSFGSPIYTIRGVGFYDTTQGASPAVSIYVDEVPVPYSIMSGGVALDLERVEILKGPQGTLYGQNSTGGAINYIAARPKSEFAARVDLTYGNFDKVGVDGYITAPLSNTLKARIAMRYDHRGDWQRSYTRDDQAGKSDLYVGRLLLDWEPTDTLRFSMNINGWWDRSDNQFGQLVAIGGNLARLPASVINYPRAPENARAADWDAGTKFRRRQDYLQTSLRADYDVSDEITLTSLSSYQQFDRESLVDADGMNITNFTISNPSKIESVYQELRLSGELTDSIDLIFGGNYAYADIEELAASINPVSSFPFLSSDAIGNQKAKTFAIFGNVDWEFTPTLTLQLGARYTIQTRRYEGCLRDRGDGTVSAVGETLARQVGGIILDIPAGACATLDDNFQPGLVRKTLKEDNLSWRIGLNYEPTAATLLYANIGRGYKNGTFPVLGATFAAQFEPATQESVLAYEVGFKQSVRAAGLQLNGAAFYYDYSDKQIRGSRIDPILGRLNQLINVPESRIYGAEAQLDWMPVDGLSIKLGGTYVASKILGNFTNVTALGQTRLLSGEPFPLTPKYQATFDLGYEAPLNMSINGFWGFNGSYQGRTNSGLGNHPVLAIDSYFLVNARAGVRSVEKDWEVSVFAQNLGNKYYWTFTNYQGPNAQFRYAGMPRTYGVRVSYQF
jgi:outer membrane receptor protein involved in Fe transport